MKNRILLAMVSLLAFTACSTIDDDYPKPVETRFTADSLYIRLTINMVGTESRSNPNGGEYGDGWEFGTDEENRVKDVCVFSYRSTKPITELTPDEAASIRIEGEGFQNLNWKEETGEQSGHTEYEPTNETSILTADFRVFAGQKEVNTTNLYFIVVANVGNITGKVSTLKELADFQDYSSWSTEDGKDVYFAMSSANGSGAMGGEGTEEDPIRYHIDIERTAARIDFSVEGSSGYTETDGLRYEVKNSDGTLKVAELYLQYIKLVNGCVLPTYMLKRVADDINGTSGFSYLGNETDDANHVPTNYVIDPRSALRSGLIDSEWPDKWYYQTTVYASLDNNYADNKPVKKESYTVGYVNENTFDKDVSLQSFATGLILKGVYVPAKVYSDYNGEGLTEATYTKGDDFWRVVKNASPDEDKTLYFNNEAAAKAFERVYNENNPDGCTITKYDGGVCYYYVWLRHGNNNDGDTWGPMEYGIVRNNIYRLQVSKVNGPGTAKPEPRNPEFLRTIIYVRRWREVEHPVIPM